MMGPGKINKRRVILILSLLFILFPIAFFLTNTTFQLQSVSGKRDIPDSAPEFAMEPMLALHSTSTPFPTQTAHTDTGNTVSFHQDMPILARRNGNFVQLFSLDLETAEFFNLAGHKWDDIHPEISPDGTKLAFSSNRNGYWDLYIFDPQENRLSQLTHTEAYDGSPGWSPDGQWLVYETYLDGNLEIQIISTEMDNPTLIRLTNDRAADHSPAWAPQGRTILFVSDRSGNDEIWLADLDNTDERLVNISNFPAAKDQDPAWSPTGEHIAWGSTLNGQTSIIILDFESGEYEAIATGTSPIFSPDGETILAVIEYPNETFLTAYNIHTGKTMLAPRELPGSVYGISWAHADDSFYQSLSTTGANNFPIAKESIHTSTSIEITSPGESINPIEGITVPYPYLLKSVVQPFYNLREQLEVEIGWNFLDYLENAFLPLTEPPPPAMPQSWLYTGKAIAINPMPLYGGWMYAVREDIFGQTYWRIYLKTRYQDGSQGMPIRDPVWDFTARYSGNTQSYENGGKLNGVPEGYWIDFTELALRFGWKRVPALNNWRTYFDGTLFNHYVHNNSLNWQAAMERLYPEEALATATRFPTKTPTPTITATASQTPRPSPSNTPTRTATKTATTTKTP